MPNTNELIYEKDLYTPNLPLTKGRLVARVPSSNDYAQKLDLKESFYLWTRSQPSGRGRQGQGWVDFGPSNLFLTIYAHQSVWAGQARRVTSGLSVWLGYWLRHALQGLVERPLYLKWPNDIVYLAHEGKGPNIRKVCGLLCQRQFVGHELTGIMCGFGVNIAQGSEAPEQAEEIVAQEGYGPGFLRELGSKPLSKGRVLRQIILELGQMLVQGPAELAPEDYSSWLLWRDQEVVLAQENNRVQGILQGVDKEGLLLIFVPEKNRTEAHAQGRLRALPQRREHDTGI